MQDVHFVSYEELEKARSSTHLPFPLNNEYLVFGFRNSLNIHKEMIVEEVKETCNIIWELSLHENMKL